MWLRLRKNFDSRVKRGTHMIICVCGLIAAGKTTFAEKQDGVVSDFDFIGSKEGQILFTLENHRRDRTVYHITCYPTADELRTFKKLDVKYVWINTTFSQCRKNIFARKRERDINNIEETLLANEEILRRYLSSDIDFEVVDVFKNEEKW